MESAQEKCDKTTEKLCGLESTNRFVEFVDLFANTEHSDEMMAVFEHIVKNQKPLEPEFQKVLDDNLWDLLSD